jgi:HK97 family phage major capsid protein
MTKIAAFLRRLLRRRETTPWQTSGDIQAYWEGEASQHTPSNPAITPLQLRLNKLTALVPVTDELLMDAAALSGNIRLKSKS